MWKAYYTGNRPALAAELLKLQRSQFGLTHYEAAMISKHLAGAASTFLTIRDDYERQVLPELIDAYQAIRRASGADFDVEVAARAELDWWKARRDPQRNSAENVGKLIAKLYATLYHRANKGIEKAGLLRAQAAALRDAGGANADWPKIEELLSESYRELMAAIK